MIQSISFSFSHFASFFPLFTFLLFEMAKIQVIRGDRSDKWTLQIKFPQLRDSGTFECQVNTEPKMSMAFRLNVVGKCSKIFYWFYYYYLLKNLMEFFVFTIRTISINASIIALKEVITQEKNLEHYGLYFVSKRNSTNSQIRKKC